MTTILRCFKHFQRILYFCSVGALAVGESSAVPLSWWPFRRTAALVVRGHGHERLEINATAWNSTRNNLWSGDRQQEMKTNENNCFSKMPMVSVVKSFLGVSCNVDLFWKNSRPQLDRNLGDQDSMLEIPRPSHGHIPLLPLPCPRRVCWLPRLPQMRRKQHLITFSWVNDDVMSSHVTQMAAFLDIDLNFRVQTTLVKDYHMTSFIILPYMVDLPERRCMYPPPVLQHRLFKVFVERSLGLNFPLGLRWLHSEVL